MLIYINTLSWENNDIIQPIKFVRKDIGLNLEHFMNLKLDRI
jgi:hypothetical protein